jgi:hypothetical protein
VATMIKTPLTMSMTERLDALEAAAGRIEKTMEALRHELCGPPPRPALTVVQEDENDG